MRPPSSTWETKNTCRWLLLSESSPEWTKQGMKHHQLLWLFTVGCLNTGLQVNTPHCVFLWIALSGWFPTCPYGHSVQSRIRLAAQCHALKSNTNAVHTCTAQCLTRCTVMVRAEPQLGSTQGVTQTVRKSLILVTLPHKQPELIYYR